MRLWWTLLFCATASATTDPSALLGRVLLKASASLKVVPNYTCVETLTRDYYTPLAPVDRRCDVLLGMKEHPTLDMSLRHTSTDRLRLEVGFTKKGEVVSRFGEGRFDGRQIDEVVPDGPVGTGAFGAMLSLIFNQDVKIFQFDREAVVSDQPRLEYSYDVPQASSHYRVKVTNGWFYTAYRGGFQIDPVREEITRMWLDTALLPAAAATCRVKTVADLASISTGAGVFPMATMARQQFVSSDGREVVNTLTFSNCREYSGHSSIHYGEGATAGATSFSAPARAIEAVPGNLEFEMELTEPIDTSSAAAGDRFFARLLLPLCDGSRVIAPAASPVEGEIVRVQLFHHPEAEAILVLRPEVIKARGTRLSLSAVRDLRRMRKTTGEVKTRMILPFPHESFSGLFQIPGDKAVIPTGFVSEWRTVAR